MESADFFKAHMPLQIPNFEQRASTNRAPSSSSFTILSFPTQSYLARRYCYPFDTSRDCYAEMCTTPQVSAELPSPLREHARFGGADSFIADMQGITSLLYGRAIAFHDVVVRQILKALSYFSSDTHYLRIGASGARPQGDNPGGEVLEYSIINGNDGGGISGTVSGYLTSESEFSLGRLLADSSSSRLLDERTVYSHTAFLSASNITDSQNVYFLIEPKSATTNVLDKIAAITKSLHFQAYAIQILADNGDGLPVEVVGRVLKQIPPNGFRTVQHAKDSASEQRFPLSSGQQVLGYGTKYPRNEPEWEQFSGHEYERRGHIHACIQGTVRCEQQHEVFHLRDLFVSPGNRCHVVVTPVEQVVRIDPVHLAESQVLSVATNRPITSSIEKEGWHEHLSL